tara:strand:- start:762 stop:1007 length:246 start_codon:yes stop_codon:yes gene_type:complete
MEEKKKKEPNIIDKAHSLILATAKHVATGLKNVDDTEYMERIDICDSCVHLVREKNNCGICGCYMPRKARWKTSKCPKEKW